MEPELPPVFQIRYPDIARNIKSVLKCLASSEFLLSLETNSSADLNLEQILKLLPSPALKDLAKSFKVSVSIELRTCRNS